MRAAGGKEVRLCAAWIELAQADGNLRAAFRVVFGRRMPTPQKLGQWLSESLGTKSGELTLIGQHSSHAKAWRYAVLSETEIAKAIAKREAAIAAREAERQAWIVKNKQRAEARALASMTARERRALEGMTIKVQAPVAPPPEPARDYIAHADAQGQITRDYLPPVPPKTETPKAAATVEKPETAWFPGCGRAPSRADLAARHRQATAPAFSPRTDDWFARACAERNSWNH